MADKEPEETFVTFVALDGRIGHAPDNREGRILIPNGAETKRRSTLFYMMHADIAPNGDLYVPGTRNVTDPGQLFISIEKFHIPSNLVVEGIAAQRKPPEVRS
jgi:hypothetical protein